MTKIDIRVKDITGQTFGRLKVLSYFDTLNGDSRWRCLCRCGKEKIIRRLSLVNKVRPTHSCGCIRKEMAFIVASKLKTSKGEKDRVNYINDIKRKYNISWEFFCSQLEYQNGRCAHCNRQFSSEIELCIDHSHTTGTVRAFTCHYCNLVIGYLEKDPQWWKGLMNTYLDMYKEKVGIGND